MKAYPERQIANRQSQIANRVCSACGAQAKRRFAKYCPDCGKNLWEDYQPLDNLRASYRLQGKTFEVAQKQKKDPELLFKKNENAALELAWAFLVYSMVPYLGILFAPGAIFMGSVGLINACRKPDAEGLKISIYNIALSFMVLAVQILLWWFLYIVPELGRNF